MIAWISIAGLLLATGCNRLTFIKPNLDKVKIEQVRQPVVARDSPVVKARMAAQQQVVQASGALQDGNPAEAERLVRAALKADPASVDAHTVMAALNERLGRSAEAGDWFKKAAEMSGGRSREVGNYAAWMCGSGRAGESLAVFDYALQGAQDESSRAGILANAGACSVQAGMDERANGYLRQAIRLDPENALALEKLAGLAEKQGQWMEARAFTERRLALPAVDAQTLRAAVRIETRLGDARAAAQYQQRLQNEFPAAATKTGN
ncbi:tetratricopeptide repeat protein [Solilutibacter pythonis]|uniref:tetratricopeptide repeat protein n=1 Tax=Solilutibacter pythonis TaxID=2483112 RepID=UPI0013145557|nr:tetratricopeptide repeat protein [Lysobacter pythonis]